jgi:hypothetical protein
MDICAVTTSYHHHSKKRKPLSTPGIRSGELPPEICYLWSFRARLRRTWIATRDVEYFLLGEQPL